MRVFSIVRQQRRTHWLGAAIGAAGALGSALLGAKAARDTASVGVLSLEDQKALFDYQQNRLEAQQNSAHQREVSDLRAAGLNPILSSGGQGAVSGLAPGIDVASYNASRTAANQQKIQARLQVANGLMVAGGKLLDYYVNSQNAVSNQKQADAAVMNAEANAANSASQIALNAKQGSKLEVDAKVALDQLLTNVAVRENLKSQTVKNYASANEINYLLDPRKDLMEAQQYGTLSSAGATILGTAAKGFRAALTGGVKEAKALKNSAKSVKDSGKAVATGRLKPSDPRHPFHESWKYKNTHGGYDTGPKSDYRDINRVYGGF